MKPPKLPLIENFYVWLHKQPNYKYHAMGSTINCPIYRWLKDSKYPVHMVTDKQIYIKNEDDLTKQTLIPTPASYKKLIKKLWYCYYYSDKSYLQLKNYIFKGEFSNQKTPKLFYKNIWEA